MSKIFNKSNQPKVEIKRNTFDLSYQNNGTFQLGKIYPVMCKEVLPGDTFEIDTAFGLRFMPLAFPIQTKMRADVHYFYCRNRNLWKDWMNFIGKTGDVSPFPMLSKAQTHANSKTGSLGDYLGLPTTLTQYKVTNVDYLLEYSKDSLGSWFTPQEGAAVVWDGDNGRYNYQHACPTDASQLNREYRVSLDNLTKLLSGLSVGSADLFGFDTKTDYPLVVKNVMPYLPTNSDSQYVVPETNRVACIPIIPKSYSTSLRYEFKAGDLIRLRLFNTLNKSYDLTDNYICAVFGCAENWPFETDAKHQGMCDTYPDNRVSASLLKRDKDGLYFEFRVNQSFSYSSVNAIPCVYVFTTDGEHSVNTQSEVASTFSDIFETFDATEHMGYYSVGLTVQSFHTEEHLRPGLTAYPFISGNAEWNVPEQSSVDNYLSADDMPYQVSSLPFRAYESIYNSFYRDQRNNPFYVDGKFDPNTYTFTTDGGEDNNNYDFHYRNWEQDFLTSAQLTPQQGSVTPLVGITSTAQATFVNTDGTQVTAQLQYADDGDTITGVDFDSDNEPDQKVRTYAMQMASEGLSINDFRMVNSYQRWLETNLRRGLKYKDQLMSHFGVDASYELLDMPEFIGGTSQMVQINQINQTSASTDGDPLGSYAAQAECSGGNKNKITKYCDEHGFIIACFSIVPTPCYSQLLPKHFIKSDPMDYYFPEFGHIGYQPIKYNEVCPLQAYVGNVSLNDTYGYQRAWYDYLASTDEVHGQFRTTLKPFILMREYHELPSIKPEFLLVNQDQMNEVFTITEIDGEPLDVCLGQLHFDVKVKRKIPRFGIPRLE